MTAPVRRGYADGPFGQIHYRIARPELDSAHPALICLHQTPKSSRDYERLMARLGEDRVVVAADTPGYGDSDAPPEPPSIADYRASILALIDGLQGEGSLPPGPFDLMGYHTGGVIAASIARCHAEKVRRLVFVSLPALDAEARRIRLANMHRFPIPREDGSNIQELWALTESLNDPRLDPEWRHRALGQCLLTGSRMPWGFRAVYDHDCMADLRALRQPSLVLCPRDDLWDETQAHATLLRDAKLVTLPDSRNGFLDLETDRVASMVIDHLDG